MLTQALGLIETIGLAAAVEAADTAIKSSNVRLIGYELTKGDGMVTVKFEGDVGAVKAAIQAAKSSAEKVSGIFSTLIIPRPAKGIDSFVCSVDTVGIELSKEVGTSTEGVEESVSSETINIEESAKDEITTSEESSADEMAASEELSTVMEVSSEGGSPTFEELTAESSPTLDESDAEKSIEAAEAPKPRRSRKKLPSS